MSLITIHEPGQTPDPHARDTAVAIGIDLGTTNSVAAIVTDNHVQVIVDHNGDALIPSVVSYGEDGTILVGHDAQRQLLSDPDTVISSVKRLMGKGLRDIPHLKGVLPYELTDELKTALAEMLKSQHEKRGVIKLDVSGRKVTPVEVSADILKYIKSVAERALSKPVTKAVITVPAYFDDAQRTATKDAARLAGLEVLRLVNEPTSAALAYGLDQQDQGITTQGVYAVYDLGGGTFDMSILRLEMGVFQVLATGGDTALGGDDFDHAIADYFLTQSGQDKSTLSSAEVKQLLATARQAKEILSEHLECSVTFGDSTDQIHYHITRDTFESLIKNLVDKTLLTCANTLHDAGLKLQDIKGIVLVGGSTRVPYVRNAVENFFEQKPLTNIDPDKVVAVGAARQAYALTAGSNNLLLDVLPLSLGVEMMGGITEKIIYRNTPLPTSRSQEFTTYQDGQTALLLHIVQGERETVEGNRSLGQFTLRGLPAMPAGLAKIKVTFTVDADGILTAHALEQRTGISASIEVKPSYGLSEDEMTQMLRQSIEHAEDDMEQRLLIEQRVEAKRILNALATALQKDGDLLSRSERETIDELRMAIEQHIKGDDRHIIRTQLENLEKLTHPFAENRINRAVQSALKGEAVSSVNL